MEYTDRLVYGVCYVIVEHLAGFLVLDAPLFTFLKSPRLPSALSV